MTSLNGNIFRVPGPLCGEFTGHRWIPRTKASDAKLECFLWSSPEQIKQSRRKWFETPSPSLWCHCNASDCNTTNSYKYQVFQPTWISEPRVPRQAPTTLFILRVTVSAVADRTEDRLWYHANCPCGVCGAFACLFALTHWGRVTPICVSNRTIFGSDNGLSPSRRQAIIWANAEILLIGPLGTNFSEISIEIHIFSFKKMHLKISSENGDLFVSASVC